jgi:hypothetical protein
MNIFSSFRHTVQNLVVSACLLPILCSALYADSTPTVTVGTLVYSTMPSYSSHRPEMAVDGDPSTYFKSAYGMGDGDDFVVLFSQPIRIQSLRVATGTPDHQDVLTDGVVETSPDAIHYTASASFDNTGIAAAALPNLLVEAIRIRLSPRHSIPKLLIRDISVQTSAKLSHAMLGPGRGFVDLSQVPASQAPVIAKWADKAEEQMESFWPDTAALLYSDDFITPNMVNVVYTTGPDVTGIAATGGGVMTVNTKWCQAHPEDTGLTVHETAHVIQAFSAYDPVWLVEGIADYIRWVKFEPEHFHPRIAVKKATYHDAYQTTATFLAWCELHYDSELVPKLNRAVRFGVYRPVMFQKYCGKDINTLWSEFVAAYQTDPAHIITPPVAPADQPRLLPAVTAGSSVPVDLSAAFNTVGILSDGMALAGSGGVDGEGNGYSAQLLGPTVIWKNVQFTLGPASSADLVSCHGSVLPVTAGNYSSLWLLGAAVEGNQMAQSLTVTYTDGSTESLSQNLSDWFQPQNFPGESRAAKMAYRTMASGLKDTRPFYVYSYGFRLDHAKTVQSLTLPDNANVKLLAVTLAN